MAVVLRISPLQIHYWAPGRLRAKLENLKGRGLFLRSVAFGKKDSCPCAWMPPRRRSARRAPNNLAFSMRYRRGGARRTSQTGSIPVLAQLVDGHTEHCSRRHVIALLAHARTVSYLAVGLHQRRSSGRRVGARSDRRPRLLSAL